jgi:hypothetical protein
LAPVKVTAKATSTATKSVTNATFAFTDSIGYSAKSVFAFGKKDEPAPTMTPTDSETDDFSIMGGDDFSIMGDGVGSKSGLSTCQWIAKYKLPLKNVTVNERVQEACSITTRYKNIDQTRNITFNSEEEAVAFCTMIKEQKELDIGRESLRFKASIGNIKLKENERVDILVEIVSGFNLPAADLLSSDPFVQVKMNGKEIHCTKHISKT